MKPIAFTLRRIAACGPNSIAFRTTTMFSRPPRHTPSRSIRQSRPAAARRIRSSIVLGGTETVAVLQSADCAQPAHSGQVTRLRRLAEPRGRCCSAARRCCRAPVRRRGASRQAACGRGRAPWRCGRRGRSSRRAGPRPGVRSSISAARTARAPAAPPLRPVHVPSPAWARRVVGCSGPSTRVVWDSSAAQASRAPAGSPASPRQWAGTKRVHRVSGWSRPSTRCRSARTAVSRSPA